MALLYTVTLKQHFVLSIDIPKQILFLEISFYVYAMTSTVNPKPQISMPAISARNRVNTYRNPLRDAAAVKLTFTAVIY